VRARLHPFPETTAQHDRITHTVPAASRDDLRHLRRRQRDHCHIARLRHRLDRSETRAPGNLGVFWIDRVDAALIAALGQHLHGLPAGSAEIRARADDCNAAGIEEEIKVLHVMPL